MLDLNYHHNKVVDMFQQKPSNTPIPSLLHSLSNLYNITPGSTTYMSLKDKHCKI